MGRGDFRERSSSSIAGRTRPLHLGQVGPTPLKDDPKDGIERL